MLDPCETVDGGEVRACGTGTKSPLTGLSTSHAAVARPSSQAHLTMSDCDTTVTTVATPVPQLLPPSLSSTKRCCA